MPYTVQTKPRDHFFSVETNESILDAALRQGYVFPYGCRSGICGVCKGKLRQGKVRYPESIAESAQKNTLGSDEILFCQAIPESDLVVEIHEIERSTEIEIKKLPCRVVKMRKLASDVMQIWIKLPENERLAFLPGQYVDFLLRDGRRRSFSIANPPHEDEYLEFHIRHVKNGIFTDYVFEKMREKDLLRLEGPLGTFFLREDSERPIILIAGGTGFAPIKAIIEHALAKPNPRPLYFYWGARSKQDLYLPELPENWVKQYPHFRYIPVLSEPLPTDKWNGRSGFVHEAVGDDFPDLSNYEVYVSGPPIMVQAAQKSFLEKGLTASCFFSDAFAYAMDNK